VGQYTRNSIKDVFINILLLIVLILLLFIPAYLCYRVFIVGTATQETDTPTVERPIDDFIDESEGGIPPGTDIEIGYEEIFEVIDGQQAYIVVPDTLFPNSPPTLIIYSHGSNTNVTTDMDDPFMKELQEYGIFFTKHNYIFAASNQHGANWGNEASILDTLKLKQYVLEEYDIRAKLKLIGFSMGGLPTMNFTTNYPDLVSKIALLAPTVRLSEWNETRALKVKDIDIKIWHGTSDVNIPHQNSVNFVNGMKKWDIEIGLNSISGKSHFEIHTAYMDEILEFFMN
jgi:predicted esterase